MLPSPLPSSRCRTVVLFPNVFLPLHIFEPRYRQMVTDALAGDRMIGMVLLQPGYEADYEGRRRSTPSAAPALITHVERLADGRFNIVLRGLERFRIVGEEPPTSTVLYRRALVEPLAERRPPRAMACASERQKLEALLARSERHARRARTAATMPDDELINALAQYLELEPIEKQALLERDGLARALPVAGGAARDEGADGRRPRRGGAPALRAALGLARPRRWPKHAGASAPGRRVVSASSNR